MDTVLYGAHIHGMLGTSVRAESDVCLRLHSSRLLEFKMATTRAAATPEPWYCVRRPSSIADDRACSGDFDVNRLTPTLSMFHSWGERLSVETASDGISDHWVYIHSPAEGFKQNWLPLLFLTSLILNISPTAFIRRHRLSNTASTASEYRRTELSTTSSQSSHLFVPL